MEIDAQSSAQNAEIVTQFTFYFGDWRRNYDGSRWDNGPWDDEVDAAVLLVDGMLCGLQRGTSGAWCGYVVVPSGHPWHGLEEEDIELPDGVHGGLTYAGKHGEAEWSVGFDCNHGGDLSPIMLKISPHHTGTYRTYNYAVSQVVRLVRQAQGEKEKISD